MPDQRDTPFSENIKALWDAVTGKPDPKGKRGYPLLVLHEAKNVLTELVRDRPGTAAMVLLGLCAVIILQWIT